MTLSHGHVGGFHSGNPGKMASRAQSFSVRVSLDEKEEEKRPKRQGSMSKHTRTPSNGVSEAVVAWGDLLKDMKALRGGPEPEEELDDDEEDDEKSGDQGNFKGETEDPRSRQQKALSRLFRAVGNWAGHAAPPTKAQPVSALSSQSRRRGRRTRRHSDPITQKVLAQTWRDVQRKAKKRMALRVRNKGRTQATENLTPEQHQRLVAMTQIFKAWHDWASNRRIRRRRNLIHRRRVRAYKQSRIHDQVDALACRLFRDLSAARQVV